MQSILRFSVVTALATLLLLPQVAVKGQSKGQVKDAAKAPAQSGIAEDPDVIRINVDLVSILATVRGKNNALMGSLEKSDFHLFEDGKEQEIKYFTKETNLPLTIGLLVDVSGSQASLLSTTSRAAGKFLDEVVKDKDLAFLISFGKDSELLQDSTSSLRLLKRGLADLKPNVAVGGIGPGPVPTMSQAGTVMYDAIYLAANERLRRESGRKIMVLITDGDDQGSKVTRQAAIEAAQKADAVIYSIFYANYGYGSDEGALKRLSEETGGKVFSVRGRTTLEDIFREIQEEMRSQYAISYAPLNGTKDGTYRKIDFKMSNKDYKVQARKGYYAIDTDRDR